MNTHLRMDLPEVRLNEPEDIIWCNDHKVQKIIKIQEVDEYRRFHLTCGCVWILGKLPELINTTKAWTIRLEELIGEAKKLTREMEKT